jgi:SAM-dependent methyltransferase
MTNASTAPFTARKQAILLNSEALAASRAEWRRKSAFFHREDLAYLSFVIPEGAKVAEIGCGIGDTLAMLKPSLGVGIDFSAAMIEIARLRHPELSFHVGDVEDPNAILALGGPFDYVLIVDTIGALDDCQKCLEQLHPLFSRETRLVVAYFSHAWYPPLRLAERLKMRMASPSPNVLSPADIREIAALADFDPVKSEQRLLMPVSLFGIGRFINRFISILPGIRFFALRHYVVCRSNRACRGELKSATVVIPARNEKGNIEPAIRRLPLFCDDIEIIFVEGHSKDGTFEEMERVKGIYSDRDIKCLKQTGNGKADAVFTAFDVARGDVLMILDADLTVPPEQLPKFWEAISSGKGEFINGTRLVYPMEDDAMRSLNLVANKIFSYLFSWLLNQRYTDTLCGTKVMRRVDYLRLKAGRSYFGDFDPFGDFDLIFGASKLSLKSIDLPIRYSARTYGATQISRFRHGLLLLRMVFFAFFKIKAR